jgi:hypothetical protein
MRRRPATLAALLTAFLVFGSSGPLLGDGDRRVDPYGGIRWNDRIQDVASRMGSLAGERRVEVAVVFRDRLSPAPFAIRNAATDVDGRVSEAISAIARDYVGGIEASRKGGDDRAYRAFHLHVLNMLFDKAGKRQSFLDAEVRLTARKVELDGVPFDMTATFQAYPGAGMTERYVVQLEGTPYCLPLVLTKVSLSAASPAARKKYPAIEASLRKQVEGLRRCRAGNAEGWCDGRPASVTFGVEGETVAIRYDAEKYWSDGLEAAYKEHLATVEGRSKRCHAKRAVDA